jgi:hypothetical protein
MTVAATEPKRDEGHSIIEAARKEMRAAIENLRSVRTRLAAVEASIPPTAQETSREDLDGDPDVETEIRTVIANGIRNCLDPLIDDLGTAVEYQPDREV